MGPCVCCVLLPNTAFVFTHRWTEIHYSTKSEIRLNSKRYARLASNARRSSLPTPECKFSSNFYMSNCHPPTMGSDSAEQRSCGKTKDEVLDESSAIRRAPG